MKTCGTDLLVTRRYGQPHHKPNRIGGNILVVSTIDNNSDKMLFSLKVALAAAISQGQVWQ